MVGGERPDLERARPVLEALADDLPMGPLGAGAAMKLAVNTVIFGLNEAVAEALVLAEAAGIDRALAYDVLAVECRRRAVRGLQAGGVPRARGAARRVRARPRGQGPRPHHRVRGQVGARPDPQSKVNWTSSGRPRPIGGGPDFSAVATYLREQASGRTARSGEEGRQPGTRDVVDGRPHAMERRRERSQWLTGSSSRTRIVLTQDPPLGELPRADILIEGDTIAAVGPDLSAEDAQVIDAAGDIVIPGFIDTHRHTWETSIRTCAPDYALVAYFGAILDKFAPKYRPEDVYAANLWGALECINAGITTLVDWSHIMNTPDHADAADPGPPGTGIRSVFAFGFPNTSLQDWWFGPDYAGSVSSIDGDLARRLRAQYFNSDDSLVTMALATRGTNFCTPEVVR